MIGASLEAVSRFNVYDDDDDYSGSDSGSYFDEEDEAAALVDDGLLAEKDEEDEKEKQAINMSRTFALFVLCLTAVTVGHVVFFFLKEDEHDDFRNSFHFLSREVAETADTKFRGLVSAMESLAALAPLLALHNGETLPFATSEDWMQQAEKVQGETCLSNLMYLPHLEGEVQLTEWEDYAPSHQFWFSFASSDAPWTPFVWELGNETVEAVPVDREFYAPVWQTYPIPTNTSLINLDLLSVAEVAPLFSSVGITSQPVLSGLLGLVDDENATTVWDFLELFASPPSMVLHPIVEDDRVVGNLAGLVVWDSLFDNLMVMGTVTVVLELCGLNSTYAVTENESVFVDHGDGHEVGFEVMAFTHKIEVSIGGCAPVLYVYPTAQMEGQYSSDHPVIFTLAVGLLFGMSILLFWVYDKNIRTRQNKIELQATRSGRIVEQMFPGRLRDMVEVKEEPNNEEDNSKDTVQLPQADFFPDVSLMFGDIVGFTAWSSLREPSQVFFLLENIFSAFDEVGTKRRIFKVETVGDCYVACCGIPNYRKDHAVAISRFARDCLSTFRQTLQRLAPTLGPDTIELGIRIGVHSGPITAGVLKGQRSRFQLFGDSVNKCARMESTGMRNRIQLTEETAELLREAGKEDWITPREDAVEAKGIGTINTYWLRTKAQSNSHASPNTASIASSDEEDADEGLEAVEMDNEAAEADRKTHRLIDWNVETLGQLLREVMVKRNGLSVRRSTTNLLGKMANSISGGLIVVEEVAETIELPEFDAKNAGRAQESAEVTLSKEVTDELRRFVTVIASMYKQNAFHNFEHATNVSIAMRKSLRRIVAPRLHLDENAAGSAVLEAMKHDNTYGITSDPLTQFAVVFSALIHDVDHRGVSNFLLAQEDPTLAAAYKNKSIAEQNSVDLAWYALMSDDLANLRAAIYTNVGELRRFRQLLVNSVIATDIFDKEQGTLRKNRWAKAFSVEDENAQQQDINRKATIVIEHLIQASDVSHTMAHWHVYQKWNERLFHEMYDAYTSGRSDKDPSLGWYKGELWFFDNYVIPLTKKLKECGVFGVSSDEYLKYAMANKEEWRLVGEGIVAQWKEKYAAAAVKE